MFFNFLKKKDDFDFQFMDYMDFGTYSIAPPVLAKKLNPLKEYQLKKYNHYHFAHCPGMYNYASMGYIIPSWANIWIKSNSADSLVFVNFDRMDKPNLPRTNFSPKIAATTMPTDIGDGFSNFNDVPKKTFRLSTPWKLYSKQDISFLLMPAYYHNPIFNNQIRAYPGVLDVNHKVEGFSTITFIFSVVEKFEHVIKVGDPLLHVIPINNSKIYTGSYGFFDGKEKHSAFFGDRLSYKTNFYRRFFQKKRKYILTQREEVKNLDKKNIDE